MSVRGNGRHEWIVVACVPCADALTRTGFNQRHEPGHVLAFARRHRGHDVRALHGTLHLWFTVEDLDEDLVDERQEIRA